MEHPTRLSPVLALRAGLSAVLVAALALVVGLGLDGPDPGKKVPVEQASVAPPATTHLQRVMSRHQCSETGFGHAGEPRSALIRDDGRLRHVSFDRGWSSFVGERPGTFVAVCLARR